MEWLLVLVNLIILVFCYRALKWVVRKYKEIGRERREKKIIQRFYEKIAAQEDLDSEIIEVIDKNFSELLK